MSGTLRVAVIGSGPAGMYTIGHLLEEPCVDVEVDLYERLATPWGLVRNGVAPDHPEKKRIADCLFNYYLHRPQVRFLGNVEVGKHVRHAELMDWYDAVVYAMGAGGDTRLGIPGEELPGSWSAREFVAWYNGHPDFSDIVFDLSCERAVIVGNGNVALDVARILTSPLEALARTDIADHAMAALRKSKVNEVVILGRRGHLQGAFHNPELEELEELPDVEIRVDGDEFPRDNEVVMDQADWQTRRKLTTLDRLSKRQAAHVSKRIVFQFLSSPVEITGNGRVEQVLVVRNHLEHDEHGRLRARPTEQEFLLDTGLILRAIGYRGIPFPGLPFDERKGIVRNFAGRVCEKDEVMTGAYVTGWIKRGAQGIIGTNKQCSAETVRHLLEDWRGGKLSPARVDGNAIIDVLKERQNAVVVREDWRRIDNLELSAGHARRRPRVKMTSIKDMLAVAGNDRRI